MLRYSLPLASLVLTATCLFTTTLRAEDPRAAEDADEVLKQARQHHRVGVDAYAEGHYAEAIESFVAADRLRPSAALSFNIAKAYERLDDVPRSLAYYREYLHRAPENAEDREPVNGRVASLSKRLAATGVQQVILRSNPPGANVLVDSEPVGSSPIVLEMRPGSHRVEFRLPDYSTERLEFELSVDRPLDVSSTLVQGRKEEVAGAQGAADPTTESNPTTPIAPLEATAAHSGRTDAKRSSGSLTRTIGFAALGASVVALGGAVTVEVMRRQAENDARQETEQVRFARALDEMNSRQTLARVLAGAGGVLAAVGGVLVVLASTSEERKPKRGLALNCAPTKCNATYSGTF